ncbi:type II secretion system protein [Candidatus Shapirobacteria bacterium]|nr:type II secretion system protein [Candidatus Shapirobacteria bacterium]
MKKKNGFTLFELMVSISIIGILTALAIVSYSSSQKKARDVRRMEDMNAVQKAAEQYYSINSATYPTAALWASGQAWTVAGSTVLESFPTDPKNSDPYLYSKYVSGWQLPPNSTGFCFCIQLENAIGNASATNCTFVNGTGQYFCIKNQQ